MKRSLEDYRNGSTNTQLEKRQQTRSGIMADLDVLDCPICCYPLTIPTYQCDNGHVACSICWPKLKSKCNSKCPECAIPISDKRCIAIERALEAVIIPCPNAELGCTKNIYYARESNHVKEYCRFSLCSCPAIDECNSNGTLRDICLHYLTSHKLKPNCFFSLGESQIVKMPINDKILVLTTIGKIVLFVLQCFKEPNGVYVAVYCIAPLAPEVEKFSYRISYSFDGETRSYEASEMKRILKVNYKKPLEETCMFVPNSLLRGQMLEMKLCISKVE